MSETKHTPTPWKKEVVDDYLSVCDANGKMIAGLNFPEDRDLLLWDFIVMAANSHEALLEAVWQAPHTSTCEFNTRVGYKPECSCWKGKAIAQVEGRGS